MKEKLMFASTMTLGILASFVFFVFYLIAYWAQTIDIWVLIALTVGTNVLLWLVSPSLTDWMQGAFYKVRRLAFEDFSREHPELASFIHEVCQKNRIPIPKLRVIEDANPTAFCYGSYPSNARLAASEGIFKYLNLEEQKGVYAHELGHIANRDFIVMTVAVTLLQVLYEIYYALLRRRRRSRSKKGDITPLIGAISYVLYLVGTYLVLYLSRTREYLADQFSAHATGNPDALSMGLVKIAYGIASEVDTESTQRLLASTRAMGISDYKAASSTGSVFKKAVDTEAGEISRDLTKVFLFDLYNPWAVLAEINSTHPLTGKRILALTREARAMGQHSIFDFEKVSQEGGGIDRNRLYAGFYEGLIAYLLPYLAGFAGVVMVLANRNDYPMFFLILGAAFLARGIYMFRKPGVPEKTTVFELMQDPYANPLKGRYVELEGSVIGKAEAGSYFGEDVKMQDRSGGLIYLNYESAVPLIGNVIFGLATAEKMIGQNVQAAGWFRRSSAQIVDLETVDVNGERIRSYTRFYALIQGVFLIVVGLALGLLRPF